MATHPYDESRTLDRLSAMSPRARSTFAAACALRLLPAYGRFARKTGRGDAPALERIADRLVEYLVGEDVGKDQLSNDAAVSRRLVPTEDDDSDDPTHPFAEDAASALTYALRSVLDEKPENAAWAGRCAYETVHYYVEAATSDASGVEAHRLVQAELSRQDDDLRDLAEEGQRGREVLRRARIDADNVFGAV